MSGPKGNIDEAKLSSWKLLDNFRQRLAKVQAAFPKSEKRPGGPVRLLFEKDSFSLMLFGLLNPVLDSMRGLCAASHLPRLQDEVCSRPVSLGSVSEAQGVFDPELLKQVFLELAGEIPTSWGDARRTYLACSGPSGSMTKTVLQKVNFKFTVLRQAPCDAVITHENSYERKALRQLMQKGETIVGDRYYGLKYGFFTSSVKKATRM